jgi:hypothetical protein
VTKHGNQPPLRTGLQELLTTVWPVSMAADSDLQRRKKLAVRSGHLAMAVMVVAAVVGSMIVDFRPLSPQAELTLYRAGQEGLTNTLRVFSVFSGSVLTRHLRFLG